VADEYGREVAAFDEPYGCRSYASFEQVCDRVDRLERVPWVRSRNRVKDVRGHQKLRRIGVSMPLGGRVILAWTADLIRSTDQNPPAVVFPVTELMSDGIALARP
jgi:hypothetical protein